MREIKFRGWDKKQQEKPYCMYRVYQLFFDINNNFYGAKLWTNDGDGSFIMRQSRDIELMQFTGLHDKNGKEIYEGDIVRGCQKTIPENKFFFTIKFDDGRFGLWHANINISAGEWKKNWDYEVIGNIYENPKFLKETP